MAASGGPNTAQAFSPSSVKIHTAPFGTTMPIDATVALATTWWDYGYLAEDGLAFNEDKTLNPTFSFEGTLVRETVTRRTYTLTGTLLQQNSQVLQTTYGGGSVAVAGSVSTFTPPSGRTNLPFAAILEWVDGSTSKRLLIPRVTSSAGASRPFAQGVVSTPLQLTVIGTTGIAPWTEISNDVTNFPVLA